MLRTRRNARLRENKLLNFRSIILIKLELLLAVII